MAKTKIEHTPQARLEATGVDDQEHRNDRNVHNILTATLAGASGLASLMSELRHDPKSAACWLGVTSTVIVLGYSGVLLKDLSRRRKTSEYLANRGSVNAEKTRQPFRNEMRNSTR